MENLRKLLNEFKVGLKEEKFLAWDDKIDGKDVYDAIFDILLNNKDYIEKEAGFYFDKTGELDGVIELAPNKYLVFFNADFEEFGKAIIENGNITSAESIDPSKSCGLWMS